MLLRLCVWGLAAGLVVGQGVRRQVSLVVTNGTIVTMDGASRLIRSGAVAIDGRDIVAVGTAAEIAAAFEAREAIDAAGQVVLPGLINTHTHAPMVLYRGLADDLALMEWLEKYIFPAEARTVTPEFVRAGTRLAALEMIKSGTTAYADMYYFEEEIAKTTRAAGLRGVLGQTIIQFPVADAKTPADGLKRGVAFLEQFAGDELITPALAPHAMYTLDTAMLKTIRAAADRHKAPLIIHLAETKDEIAISQKQYKTTPVHYLESIGFWGVGPEGSRALAAHAVHVTPEEIRILASHGVGVSHNPESNMKLASGTAPVPAMRTARLNVGLGTDGAASNNDLDMFEAMRQAAFLHKLQSGDPRVLPARTVLGMATIEGARAIGLAQTTGSLEAGKRADLIIVSMTSARQTPLYDPVSHLVYVTRGDDVQTTIVNGKLLMRDRRMLTLDEQAVLTEAGKHAELVRAAVGK
jgi:5-methylthioadenosine/S-adenosylhomocysteine deaminase